jgi:hypothetical protein
MSEPIRVRRSSRPAEAPSASPGRFPQAERPSRSRRRTATPSRWSIWARLVSPRALRSWKEPLSAPSGRAARRSMRSRTSTSVSASSRTLTATSIRSVSCRVGCRRRPILTLFRSRPRPRLRHPSRSRFQSRLPCRRRPCHLRLLQPSAGHRWPRPASLQRWRLSSRRRRHPPVRSRRRLPGPSGRPRRRRRLRSSLAPGRRRPPVAPGPLVRMRPVARQRPQAPVELGCRCHNPGRLQHPCSGGSPSAFRSAQARARALQGRPRPAPPLVPVPAIAQRPCRKLVWLPAHLPRHPADLPARRRML